MFNMLQEPEISYDLQLKGHMTKHACVDLSDIQDQFFWRVPILIYLTEILYTYTVNRVTYTDEYWA